MFTMDFIRLVFVSLIVCMYVNGRDDTLVERAYGTDVVEIVCSKIEMLFGADKQFLRRIAYVESKDGADENTFRSGYFGGIWQVDRTQFLETKNSGNLDKIKKKLEETFDIDWNKVSWEDLLKPFYSGLAARMYFYHKKLSIPSSITGQANLWQFSYKKKEETADKFHAEVNKLENDCKGNAADIIFILDESGSIKTENFNKTKEFLKEAVSSFKIGPDPFKETRVSLIKFNDEVSQIFGFNNFSTKESYIAAIERLPYSSGDTRTYLALKHLREKAFSEKSGARPLSSGIPRVAIVLTDGGSSNFHQTVTEARMVHKIGVTVLAVGIGSEIKLDELKEIATSPYQKHMVLLDDFTDINGLNGAIEEKACSAPTILVVSVRVTSPFGKNEKKAYKTAIPKNGATIGIESDSGIVTVYNSRDTAPNPARYEQVKQARPGSPAVFYYSPSRKRSIEAEHTSHFLIIGDSHHNTNINIDTLAGNHDPCSKNPCAAEQACQHRLGFAHECVAIAESMKAGCKKGIDGHVTAVMSLVILLSIFSQCLYFMAR